jgi:peptide deformylase
METGMIREILKMGDSRLLQVAGPVEDIHDLAQRAIIADMYETMHAANGVGLAAPQIGVGLRLMIFGFNENQRYPNEKLVPDHAHQSMARSPDRGDRGGLGRLSFGAWMRGLVPRATRIRYGGTLEDGSELAREANGFHARVFQHEFDHLNGVLYPRRIKDMTKFGFIEALFPESELAALEAD